MLQPRVLTCAPNSGILTIKTFGTHAPMIHLLRYNYSVNFCNNIFVIILDSYLREMNSETNIEMHPDVKMHPDNERHPDNEMHPDNAMELIIGMHFIVGIHLDIGMHPKVEMHPDVEVHPDLEMHPDN